MRRKRYTTATVSVVMSILGTSLLAQQPVPESGSTASATQSSQTEDYRELKREVDDLRQQVDLQNKQLTATTQPINRSTAPGVVKPTNSSSFNLLSSNNISEEAQTLFAPRVEEEYFSSFGIMNPAHMRADMPVQIGNYKDLNLYMGLQTVGRLQALHQENVSVNDVKQSGLNPGFQDPFANLSFLASISDKLDVYFDTYVASRPHASTMYGHEGYLLFKQLPSPFDSGLLADTFDYVNVKVGAFDIDFGDDNYRRSNNGRVQRNPLVGNPLVDPNVEEIGGEVYSLKGPVYWLFGMGSGTTTEHFDYGANPSFHGKLWAYPLPDVRTSVSAYHVDLSGSADKSYLYSSGRSGGTFASVFGGDDNPGQILPQAGKDVTAIQGDVTWNRWPFELYTNVGWVEDSNTNGSAPGTPSERWIYGAIEPVYHITPSLYLAGRYSCAFAQSIAGTSSNGWVDRAEIGAGYWVTNNVLGKLEYVYEQYHGFGTAEGTVSGVDGFNSPRFDGVVVEVSFAF